jgi:hypothetical protein
MSVTVFKGLSQHANRVGQKGHPQTTTVKIVKASTLLENRGCLTFTPVVPAANGLDVLPVDLHPHPPKIKGWSGRTALYCQVGY